MKATPSAPCSTSLRVELWMTWPGTVNSLTRTVNPDAVVEAEREQVEEQGAVVPAFPASSAGPRPSGASKRWIACRFVVFPLSAGP